MKVECLCGTPLTIDDAAIGRPAVCSRCGRWAYFTMIAGRLKRVGPWHNDHQQGARLPYDDER